jgi:hypothetical protein
MSESLRNANRSLIRSASKWWRDLLTPGAGMFFAFATLHLGAAATAPGIPGTWPQPYAVRRDQTSGLLTLSTPYYTVQHDLKRGGAIATIRLTHGQARNLLMQPIGSRIRDEQGMVFTDLKDPAAEVSHKRNKLTEIVTVNCRLADEQGRASNIRLKTVFEYHWGYIKIHKEFAFPMGPFRAREVCPLTTVLAPSLSDYGYREGVTEQEGAPPFNFGSCRWGKLHQTADSGLKTSYVPRYMMFADAGVEGLEWFVGSDLTQWELPFTGRRGQGQCLLRSATNQPGLELAISVFQGTTNTATLENSCAFDSYLGLPILEEHARKPWFHTSFNRNRGAWVSSDQVKRWAESGIQTVHCHNDGDYYDDGLFWRDGSYPPYPDMEKYDKVIGECHQAGIRVATYFSNKELHPGTKEFQLHGSEWGRKNTRGDLQHNIYRGTNEFGVQMCLRSGWLDFLKSSINRVLTNHRLDGVYYDWNVALLCCNRLHEGKQAGAANFSGHWDIEELLNLMEWTRRRVGTNGLVIIHNTTVPMFVTENFADDVVANEWGYGKWSDKGPIPQDLPLEWSLVGARARGVISYGQIDDKASRRFHRLFALEALLGGVTPWPASPETFELFSILKPLGQIEKWRFADWRNAAVVLQGTRCASAIYSRAGESYVIVANLDDTPQEIHCIVHADKLPYPLTSPLAVETLDSATAPRTEPGEKASATVDASQLIREGAKIVIAADSAMMLHLRSR